MRRRRAFGSLADGTTVDVITLGRPGGLEVNVLTYGCIIASLTVPDAAGRTANVVLGFDRFEPYLDASPYFGAVIGRCANRIGGAQFTIDGRQHRVSTNEPPNHLHGGFQGFDKHVWEAEAFADGDSVILRRTSPEGEEGYPGALEVEVRYELGDRDLRIAYHAVTSAPTHVNLTQHSYFNLSGSGDVLSHCLAINAGTFLPVDERLIPTGDIAPVANSPFDFQESTAIGSRLHTNHAQLRRGGGYDHNFNLNHNGAAMTLAARVLDPSSGRTLELRTTEPGLQFYAGQVVQHRGFCLEPQHYPDSPNRPEFPSTVLRPGQRYESATVYTFGAA